MMSDAPSCREWVWSWSRSQDVDLIRALNLVWEDGDPLPYLSCYQALAERLNDQPEAWSHVMTTPNWRLHLLGVCALMSSGDSAHFELLQARVQGGSMVLPQLMLAIGLLHPVEGMPYLNELAFDLNRYGHRRAESASRVLECLGHEAPSAFDPTQTLDALYQAHALTTQPTPFDFMAFEQSEMIRRVITTQWSFWRDVVAQAKDPIA